MNLLLPFKPRLRSLLPNIETFLKAVKLKSIMISDIISGNLS